MNKFSEYRFPQAVNEALAAMNFVKPTPVQVKAMPLVLEGKDLLVAAQTGTGKTAAFAIPLLARLLTKGTDPLALRPVLVVSPTRELAEQTGKMIEGLVAHAHHIKVAVIIGGAAYDQQIAALRAKPSFVVGTPGRLIDQIGLKHLDVRDFGTLVIDEADRLLDMGFEPQMNQIVGFMPSDRQSLLFSATLPEDIMRLASKFLREPVRIKIGETSKPIDKIKQKLIPTNSSRKEETLLRETGKIEGSIIVFVRTRSRAEKVAKVLTDSRYEVARIHGDRTQAQRSAALESFRTGAARILVATDIAARGIDVPHVQHVINYDLPVAPEDYIHRIGRTARNGAEGNSIAFVTPEEMDLWARIFKLIHGHFPEGYKKTVTQTHGAKGQSGVAGKAGSKEVRGVPKGPLNREDRRRAVGGLRKKPRFDSDEAVEERASRREARGGTRGDATRGAAGRTGARSAGGAPPLADGSRSPFSGGGGSRTTPRPAGGRPGNGRPVSNGDTPTFGGRKSQDRSGAGAGNTEGQPKFGRKGPAFSGARPPAGSTKGSGRPGAGRPTAGRSGTGSATGGARGGRPSAGRPSGGGRSVSR